ncbi:ABC transporter substrate-binding protein, partial [Nonomuraea sp. NPDC004297]
MSRTRRGLFAAIGALAMTLSACAPSAPEDQAGPGAASGPITLDVWGWRQEDAAAYQKIFKIYEDAHPGVKVKYVPYKADEYDTILRTGLSDANGPDVAQLRSYGLLQPLVAAKSLVPLDDQVKELSGFPEPVLDGARGESDKRVYGVPFAIQSLHVIYNKKLFAKHGVNPPKTWDEMTAAFDKLAAADLTPLATTITDTWMLPIQQEIFGATSYGGYDYLEKMRTGAAKFTDRPWVESLTKWKSTSKYWPRQFEGVSYVDAQALFTSEQAAMFPGGIWELAVFGKSNPDLDLGIFNVPPPEGAA